VFDTWRHFRRLAASLMLAAVASLVLHGAVVAGAHGHTALSDCSGHASGHVHAAHHHLDQGKQTLDGTMHEHAGSSAHDDGFGTGELCCGVICSVALRASSPEGVVRVARSAVVEPDRHDPPADTNLDGPRKPPRATGIA
jgi:hypothetical protein